MTLRTAVFERGSWWKGVRRESRRCLILGLGVLPGLTETQLKAILAHEYGHFGHADTQWAAFAHAVGAALWKTVDVLPKWDAYMRSRPQYIG